jgi:hypothetical protein
MNDCSTPDLPNSHRKLRAGHDQNRAEGVVVCPALLQQHHAARVVPARKALVPARKALVDTHVGDEAIALPRFGAVFTGAAFGAAHARWEV